MGARAKQAIAESTAALKKMKEAAGNLELDSDALNKAADRSLELNQKRAVKKDKVERAKVGDDSKKLEEEFARAEKEWIEVHVLCDKLRERCRQHCEDIEDGYGSARLAIANLRKLVAEKQKLRNTKNVLKKVVALAKSKSLGELTAEADRIAKAMDRLGAFMETIRKSDYA